MPKASTEKRWSHGRTRGVINNQAKTAIRKVAEELNRDPAFVEANGGKINNDLIARLAREVASDLVGPGLKAYEAEALKASGPDLTVDEIIDGALANLEAKTSKARS